MSQPILHLLAGNGSAADWWDDALPYFQRYRPMPLELPGFGDHPAPPCEDLAAYAQALLDATAPGHAIMAVGVNALLVLHALQRRPGHFGRSVLLAPVGAFLWERRLPKLMAPKPLRKAIHWLLAHYPALFARKFSNRTWTPAQYRRMGAGYARCRAFLPHWDLVRADTALPLLEWVTDRIELVWGDQDAMLGVRQAAAWSAILARADLTVTLQPGWGHYPWIDAPAAFAQWLEGDDTGFVAHTKGGRLALAAMAGLPVPSALSLSAADDPRLPGFLASQPDAEWAIRSSSHGEDQADAANAGLHTTFLRVPASQAAARVAELLDGGLEEAVVQRFITPVLSGIAFVRHLAVEVEWVEGHLETLADGQASPQRAILSRLGEPWQRGTFATAHGLSARQLWDFLQRVLRAFHYVPGDVEWAWDGTQLWLLQYRPISTYGWHRHLTAANIAEILPPQPSRLVEYAQRRAAGSIPAIMARWDARVLRDNEPFTALYGGASYINNDLFLARLADWGCRPPTTAARSAVRRRRCAGDRCACCAHCRCSGACCASRAGTCRRSRAAWNASTGNWRRSSNGAPTASNWPTGSRASTCSSCRATCASRHRWRAAAAPCGGVRRPRTASSTTARTACRGKPIRAPRGHRPPTCRCRRFPTGRCRSACCTRSARPACAAGICRCASGIATT